MSKKLKNYVILILKILITGAALYYVYTRIDFPETWRNIKQAGLFYLMLSIFFFIFSKVVSSFRLNRYFQNISISLSEKTNLKLYWLGMFYNLSLPGGIGGDGYKVYLLNKKYKIKAMEIFWAVILDRVIGVLALFCLSVVLLYFVPLTFPFKSISVLAIPLSISIAYLVYKKFYTKHINIFFITNLQSLIVQVLQVICALMILFSLGENQHIISYMFVFLVSSIVAVLPLTIGGAGAREVTFLFGAEILNLDVNIAVALSVLFYAITALVSMWGMVYIVKSPVPIEEAES